MAVTVSKNKSRVCQRAALDRVLAELDDSRFLLLDGDSAVHGIEDFLTLVLIGRCLAEEVCGCYLDPHGRQEFEPPTYAEADVPDGRPDQVQLIFERRVTRRTPGRFRTRVVTEGVTPSLHIDYKHTRIKQYHKEGRALRTETTINNTRDFAIGKRLHNLPALRAIGFQANRRLLHVQTISHDCAIGEDAFQRVNGPVV